MTRHSSRSTAEWPAIGNEIRRTCYNIAMPKGVYKHGVPWNKLTARDWICKQCSICGVTIRLSPRAKTRLPKFCSRTCRAKGRVGYRHSTATIQKIKLAQPRLGTGLEAKFVSSVRRSKKY